MLTRKQQRKYLAKKENDWETQLQVFGLNQEGEALHRLRVAIKKIKAFARMAEACSGARTLKDIRLLKKMFHQAGTIRDAGNHMQLLEHFHPAPAGFKQEQQQLKESETAVFVDHISQYLKNGRKAGRRLLADVHSIPQGRIRNWYARRLIHIGVLLMASGDRLHKARRQIKELLYVNGLLPSRLSGELGLDTDYLESLQEAIGQWHDSAVVVAAWAGKDLTCTQAMVKECREKETAVHRLADDFYLRAHVL